MFKKVKKSLMVFMRDESGFDLVQFSVYTAVAVGAFAISGSHI